MEFKPLSAQSVDVIAKVLHEYFGDRFRVLAEDGASRRRVIVESIAQELFETDEAADLLWALGYVADVHDKPSPRVLVTGMR